MSSCIRRRNSLKQRHINEICHLRAMTETAGILHRFGLQGCSGFCLFDARGIHSSSLWNWCITALHAKQYQRAQLLWIVSRFRLWVYLKGWSLTHIPRNKNTRNTRVQKRIYHTAKKSNFGLELKNKKAKLSHLLWNVKSTLEGSL